MPSIWCHLCSDSALSGAYLIPTASFTSELARGEPNEDRRKELNEEVRKDIKRLAMNFLTDR